MLFVMLYGRLNKHCVRCVSVCVLVGLLKSPFFATTVTQKIEVGKGMKLLFLLLAIHDVK
jgi:hypothetical protein